MDIHKRADVFKLTPGDCGLAFSNFGQDEVLAIVRFTEVDPLN